MYVIAFPGKILYFYIFDKYLQIIFITVSGSLEYKGQHCCDFLCYIWRGNMGCISLSRHKLCCRIKALEILKAEAKPLGIESICLVGICK